MNTRVLLYDQAEMAWQSLCDDWQASDAILVVSSEMRKSRFLLSMSQKTILGDRVITVQEFWQLLARGQGELPKEISRIELRVWLTQTLRDQAFSNLAYLGTSSGGVDSLIDHLLLVDQVAHDTYCPITKIELGVQKLREALQKEGYVTREGMRHYLAIGASESQLPARIIFAPLGVPSPSLSLAMRSVAHADIYMLANVHLQERVLIKSQLQDLLVVQRYQDTGIAPHLFGGKSQMTQGRHVEAAHDVEAALEMIKTLTKKGVKADKIGLVCNLDAASLIEEKAQMLNLPVLIRQKISVRDTQVTSLMLALLENNESVGQLLKVAQVYGYDVDSQDVEPLQHSKGTELLCHLYDLGQKLLQTDDAQQKITVQSAWAHAYLDSLHQAISSFQKLEIDPADPVQTLMETQSISLLRGRSDGVTAVSHAEAGNFMFEYVFVCNLNADDYPPVHMHSAFISKELYHEMPEFEVRDFDYEFMTCVSAGKKITFVRSLFDMQGQIFAPSRFWQETKRFTPDTEHFAEMHYQEIRRKLRRSSRQGDAFAQNIDQAIDQIGRERLDQSKLPKGYFGGTKSHFSVTELESFLKCPYGWFVRYILKPQNTRTDVSAQRGEIMHSVLAKVFEQKASARLNYLNSLWREDLMVQSLFNTVEQEVYLARLQAVIARYGDASWPFSEHHLECDLAGNILPDYPDVKITGRADRIDINTDGLVVIDYKNRRRLQKPSAGKKLEDLQSTLYPKLASLKFGKDSLGMMYISIFHMDHEGLLNMPITGLDNKSTAVGIFNLQLERAILLATQAVEQITAGEITSVGKDCPKWCPHHLLSQTNILETR